MSVTLVKGATTVTLRDPERRPVAEQIKDQSIDRKADGNLVVYDHNVTRYQAEILWETLNDSEITALVAFHDDDADGAMQTWTYTDVDASTYTARFIDGSLRCDRQMKNVWSVRFVIEIDSMMV